VQPPRGKASEGLVDLCLLHFLDCQVHNRARACGPVQIGQHQWPVFGRDVLHRIDREDSLEFANVRQVLQRDLFQLKRDPPRPGLGQHARRPVNAHHLMASRSDHRNGFAGSARCIKYDPARRD